MSAQQLSDECSRLGVSLSRGTIAKLESGTRGFVTADELLVLAAALDVPVLRLLAPLDDGDVEVLPGKLEPPWEAASRLAGMETAETLLVYQYSQTVSRLSVQLAELIRAQGEALGPRDLVSKMVQGTLADLVDVRQRAAAAGLAVPELPAGIRQRMAEAGFSDAS